MGKRGRASSSRAGLLGPAKTGLARPATSNPEHGKSSTNSATAPSSKQHAKAQQASRNGSADTSGKAQQADPRGRSSGGCVPQRDQKAKQLGHGGDFDRVTGKKRGTLFSAAPSAALAPHDRKHKPHTTGKAGGYSAVAAPQNNDQQSHNHVEEQGAKRQRHVRGDWADKPVNGVKSSHHKSGAKAPVRKARKRAKATGNNIEALIPDLMPPTANVQQPAEPAPAAAPHDPAHATGRSNWERLQATIKLDKPHAPQQSASVNAAAPGHDRGVRKHGMRPRKRRALAKLAQHAQSHRVEGVRDGALVPKGPGTEATEVVALDCEMVGVGVEGKRSALARVVVINAFGNVVLDTYVRPREKVTDWRTHVSGIRAADLHSAVDLEEAMERTTAHLEGRIVVGHALHNDLEVLMLQGVVPRQNLRDTAVFPPLMAAPREGAKLRARALRHLAADELGVTIQHAEHSPVVDARAALYIYQKHAYTWEQGLQAGLFKIRGVKASGKLAKGEYRMMSMRAGATHGSAAQPAIKSTVGRAGGENAASDDEFSVPSAADIARMKERMANLIED